MLFLPLAQAVFLKDVPRVAGACARAGVPALLNPAPRDHLRAPFLPFFGIVKNAHVFLPTLKEPKALGQSWVPQPLGGAHPRDPPHQHVAGDPQWLLHGARITPLRAETLLFHSSRHRQGKSREGLFLALFSVVT